MALRRTLQDRHTLSEAVIRTADSDRTIVADDLLGILRGTGKTFISTYGSVIVANWNRPSTAKFAYAVCDR